MFGLLGVAGGGLASQCHVALCYVPRISYESAQTHQRDLKRDFDIIVKPELFKFFFKVLTSL